jgi:hypothetical protein
VALLDDFNRADASPLSGDWTTVTGLADLRLVSNTARSISDADSAAWYGAAGTWANDQTTSVVYGNGGNTDAGPCVRMATGAYTMYMPGAHDGIGHLYKVVGSSFSTLGNGTGYASPITVLVSAIGTTILYSNSGVTQVTQTDSAITSGKGGMFIYDDAVICDDFTATGFTAGGAAQDTPELYARPRDRRLRQILAQ